MMHLAQLESGDRVSEQLPVGSRGWLQARIAEHKATQEQALAQANAHAGAVSAYQRLLDEMPKTDLKLVDQDPDKLKVVND